jgi:hypothetical protein
VCHDCYRGIDRKMIEEKKNEFENRRCCICGSVETYIKLSGGPLWRKYKGDDWRNYKAGSNTGIWDGKSYLCDNCYGRIISNFPDSRNNLRKKILEIDKLILIVHKEKAILQNKLLQRLWELKIII